MVYESQLTTGQLALQSCQEYACGTPAELTALGHLGWACPRSDSLNDGSMQPSYLTPSKMYGKTQGHIEVEVVFGHRSLQVSQPWGSSLLFSAQGHQYSWPSAPKQDS